MWACQAPSLRMSLLRMVAALQHLPDGNGAVGCENQVEVGGDGVGGEETAAHDEVVGPLLGDGGDGLVGDVSSKRASVSRWSH